MYHDVIIAGFGGQGVLFIGNLLAQAGLEEDYQVSFMPSYGVEMRGGTANCNVILSSEEIGSPIPDNPCSGLILNEASLIRFAPIIQPRGLLLFNSSLMSAEKIQRQDVTALPVPANELAAEVGNSQLASLVSLGCFVEWTGVVRKEVLPRAMKAMLSPKAIEKALASNLAALEAGYAWAQRSREQSSGKASQKGSSGKGN
jgi:2-oxoglutarate ferredoxin oxidoreductase subunit gamma